MANQKVNRIVRKTALSLALGMCFAVPAYSQSTTGTLFGTVPVAAGETVEVRGNTGLVREVTVDSAGRYRIGNLPADTYTVTLKKAGAVVETRREITPTLGSGTEVSFSGASGEAETGGNADATTLGTITVAANRVPPIDVSSVDSRTVVTAKELAVLPLSRSAESIALLAPGTVQGSANFSNGSYRTVSFGGAGVTENAYYINGYNVVDPLSGIGGLGLPYNTIAQQETYTGGYSAMYGRSDGGVISQVGKRGTNDWHFGAEATWVPRFLDNAPKDIYYPNNTQPDGYAYQNPELAGTKYRERKDNVGWITTYSAYAGGPLIPDTLFIYLAAEAEKRNDKSTGSVDAPYNTYSETTIPKFYGKLDWNINDSNTLEFTAVKNSDRYSGKQYDYDYDTGVEGAFHGNAQESKLSNDLYVGKFTSYITDDLTLSALYGETKVGDFNRSSTDPLPFINGAADQDPALNGGEPIRNSQTQSSIYEPDAGTKTHGYRFDLAYQLGSHLLSAGIDNMYYRSHNEGQSMSGPGYRWSYFKTNAPNDPLDPNLGVGAPGGDGYYVSQYKFITTTSMSVDQEAYYLEDAWQVSDNLLLKLGLRNDKFVNKNNAGVAYVTEDQQWAPRLGFSWDIRGDSTLKLFGNAGRYYLALPNSVAIRGASASTYTNEYFTYTGIDGIGVPTGLVPLGPGPVSSNGEYGVPPDAATITSTNLKAQYQDEFILGLDAQISPNWVAGIKGTYRELRTAIDDVCDVNALSAKVTADGNDPADYDIRGCYIFNPGRSNTFRLNRIDGTGSTNVNMSNSDWGFTEDAERKYYALDMYLEHPFDGKWGARLNYTFSRSYGNTEGQVKSDIGQTDVSKTQDWDSGALMDYASGILANNRRHTFRARGSYQIAPEWLVSGIVLVQSGAPKSCLGYYGTDESDPISYGSSYHWCAGKPSAPGAEGDNPWTARVDLGLTYRPQFANNRLGFGIDVINALNSRRKTQSETVYETNAYTLTNEYGMGTFYQEPRYVRFSASYDF